MYSYLDLPFPIPSSNEGLVLIGSEPGRIPRSFWIRNHIPDVLNTNLQDTCEQTVRSFVNVNK
jgi:hypothetical protein